MKGQEMAHVNTAQNIDDVVQQVIKAIQALRFGSVEITIHDGRITQIETREKLRIGSSNQKNDSQN
jgi:hypothetical protein